MSSLTRRFTFASLATLVLVAPLFVHSSDLIVASGVPAATLHSGTPSIVADYNISALGPLTRPCGGAVPKKSTGGTWTCAFDDEFDGTSLDPAKWAPLTTAATGLHSGAECFVDDPSNVFVAGGNLNLVARRAAEPFTCSDPFGDYQTQYTSGMVTTWGKFSQAYGRFTVRAKFPPTTVAGLQEALWLWPQDQNAYGSAWPASGEIDIAEAYSRYPDRVIPYVHYNYDPATTNPTTHVNVVTNNYCLISDVAQFHEYTLEWTPTTLTITYDGRACLSDTWVASAPLSAGQPFDRPFFVALTQALGIGTNAFDPATTPLPATTQVDYVRVWR